MSDPNEALDDAYDAMIRRITSVPLIGWVSYLLYIPGVMLLLAGLSYEIVTYMVWGVSTLLIAVFFGAIARIIRLLSEILHEQRGQR